MARTILLLLEIALPIVIWGSLGLWGLSIRTAVSDDRQGIPLTRGLVFQAIACGPLSFLVNWRKAARRIATRERKYVGGTSERDEQ